MEVITLKVPSQAAATLILGVLNEAEEEGTIDFAFDATVDHVDDEE